MANDILSLGYIADTAIPRYYAVRQVSTEHVAVANAASQQVLGIAQEAMDATDVANGRAVRVRHQGISRAVAGAVIALGDVLATAADGRLVPAPAPAVPGAGATTTVYHVGKAVTPAAAAGDWFDVELTPGAKAQRFG